MENLQNINLESNLIETIQENSFYNLKNLTSLNLKNNKIISFEDNVFVNLLSLRILEINSQFLYNLSNMSLNGLVGLKYLHLSFNSLTHITSDIFFYLTSLTNFSLNNNQIAVFECNTLKNLRYLNLNDNKLKQLKITFKIFLQFNAHGEGVDENIKC